MPDDNLQHRYVLLLLLRGMPTALKIGSSKRQHLLEVGREVSEWGKETQMRMVWSSLVSSRWRIDWVPRASL